MHIWEMNNITIMKSKHEFSKITFGLVRQIAWSGPGGPIPEKNPGPVDH